MVSMTSSQREEPDLVNAMQTNLIFEGCLKIPLEYLSKEDAVEIIQILLKKLNSATRHEGEHIEGSSKGEGAFKRFQEKAAVESVRNFKGSITKLRACSFCQKRHIFGSFNCAAFGKTCLHCGKLNHLKEACWFLYPHLQRSRYYRKSRRWKSDLRKSFSAPTVFDFSGNGNLATRSSDTMLIHRQSSTTAHIEQDKVLNNRHMHRERDSKVIDVLTQAPEQQGILDSGLEVQDAHRTIDVAKQIQDSHGHKTTWAQIIHNGDFGFDVSLKKLDKGKSIEDNDQLEVFDKLADPYAPILETEVSSDSAE